RFDASLFISACARPLCLHSFPTRRSSDLQPYTIIGIMPPRFGWWTEDGVWLPMGIDSRDQRGVFPIVRLASGTSSSVADQRLHVLHREFAKANPTGYPRESIPMG